MSCTVLAQETPSMKMDDYFITHWSDLVEIYFLGFKVNFQLVGAK